VNMLKRIDHIGIVVKELEGAIERFQTFGLPASEVTELKAIGVKIALLPLGGSSIELIYFTEPQKGPQSVVRSQQGAINHICFEVDHLEASIRDFESKGARLVEGYPKQGVHGRVAFFDPQTTEDVLIELCEH